MPGELNGDRLEQLPISWIEHFAYCERQWGLIALEAVFDDNEATVRGHLTHREVDKPIKATQRGIRQERALPLWSRSLGLIGKADVVEFHGDQPVPVEYKAGNRLERPTELQLAAQGLCLEEMFGCSVPMGQVYLAGRRERHTVEIGDRLRDEVVETVSRMRQAWEESRIAKPVDDERCSRCSLNEKCLPTLSFNRRRVAALVVGAAKP